MENVNVVKGVVMPIPMEPVANIKATRAAAEKALKVAAIGIAKFVTATRDVTATKRTIATSNFVRDPISDSKAIDASVDKAIVVALDGLAKFFEAISAETTAELAEAKAAGRVVAIAKATAEEATRGAEGIAERAAAERAARSVAEEADNIEIASRIQKNIKDEVARCIPVVNRVAEVMRIAKAATGEGTTNIRVIRAAAAEAAEAAEAFVSSVFIEAARDEATIRWTEAPRGIEYEVARNTAKKLSDMLKAARETERRAHAEEEATTTRTFETEYGPPAVAFSQGRSRSRG